MTISQLQLLNFSKQFIGFELDEEFGTTVYTTFGQLYIKQNNTIAFRVLDDNGDLIMWFEQNANGIDFESSTRQQEQKQIEKGLEFAQRVSVHNELTHFCVYENNGENLYNVWLYPNNQMQISTITHKATVTFGKHGIQIKITKA